MCQKAGLVKRFFVIFKHSSALHPKIWRIIPPLTQAEEIYKKKQSDFLTKGEICSLVANTLDDSQYTIAPLEIPVNWLKGIQATPPQLR